MALNFSEVLDGLTSPDGLSELLPLQAPPVPTHFATLEGLKAPGTEQQDSVRHADFKIFQPAISGYVNGLRPVLRCPQRNGRFQEEIQTVRSLEEEASYDPKGAQ